MKIIDNDELYKGTEKKRKPTLKGTTVPLYRVTFKKYNEIEDVDEVKTDLTFGNISEAIAYAEQNYSFWEIYNHRVNIDTFYISEFK